MKRLSMLLAGEGITGAGAADPAAPPAAAPAAAPAVPATPAAPATPAPAAAAPAAPAAPAAAAPATPAAGEGAKPSFLAGATTGQDGKAPAAPGAPADLDKLVLPEGVTQVDTKLLDGFKAFAKEKQLQPAQAQELLNFYAKHAIEQDKVAAAAAEQRQVEARKALEADPTIGGANLPKSMELAHRAIVTIDRKSNGLGSAFVKELDAAGLGDSLAAARLLAFLGQQLGEDTSGTLTPVAPPAVGSEEARLNARYGKTRELIKQTAK